MTKLEIIQETADYYSADPKRRGINGPDGECVYRSEDGKKCALGRCFTLVRPTMVGSAKDLVTLGFILDDELQEQYRGHEVNFWQDLQQFHDMSCNWDDEGLTEVGNEHLKILIEKYKNI